VGLIPQADLEILRTKTFTLFINAFIGIKKAEHFSVFLLGGETG
jgi:hypothetical protein